MPIAKADFKSQEVVNTLTFTTFHTIKNNEVPALLRDLADMFDAQLKADASKAEQEADVIYGDKSEAN